MTSTTPFAGLSSGSAAAHALDLPGSTQFPAMLALLLVLLALPFLALSCAVQVPFSTDGEPNLKSSKPATALKLLKLKQAPDLEQFPGRHGPQLRRLSPASPLPFCFPPPPPRPLLPLSSENIGHAFEVYQELGVLARGVRIGLCKGGEFLFRRGSRFLSFAHLPTQLVRQVLASFLASSSSLQGEVFRAVSRLDVRDLWTNGRLLSPFLPCSSRRPKRSLCPSKFFKVQTWRGFLSVIPSDHAIGTLSLCPN